MSKSSLISYVQYMCEMRDQSKEENMITLQHTALYAMALAAKRSDTTQFYREFHENLPFVLLPDAIRAYISDRKAGHFEMTPDWTSNSWMVYPSKETLKILTPKTAVTKINFHIAQGIPKCAIGEVSNINAFDRKNWGHHYYHPLRIHKLQDYVLDVALRKKMIDDTKRFEDAFAVRGIRGKVLNGIEFRKQLAMFEDLGFIYLAGKLYERTGIVIDREWLDMHVKTSLETVYPEDLAENTFGYMAISEDLSNRISNLDFLLSEYDKKDCLLAEDMEGMLDEIYAEAYQYTVGEI